MTVHVNATMNQEYTYEYTDESTCEYKYENKHEWQIYGSKNKKKSTQI